MRQEEELWRIPGYAGERYSSLLTSRKAGAIVFSIEEDIYGPHYPEKAEPFVREGRKVSDLFCEKRQPGCRRIVILRYARLFVFYAGREGGILDL